MVPELETFREILAEADAAGREAVRKLNVIPMIVGEAIGFTNQIGYSRPTEFVADGVCGFAWTYVYPKHKGNTKLGKQERAALEACDFQQDYCNPKKYTLWISDFDQSMQKKYAYAKAFADVLCAHGMTAGGQCRMD